jgi:phosphoribosylamine--glycine ligase
MVPAQDHKRRFDGDAGPNTGGMGAYSIDSILSPEQHETVLNRIIRPTLQAAKSYSGILYAGLMLTAHGPKLLEYNARFGDPETQVILARLKTDLLDVLIDMAEHRLSQRRLEWRPDAAATVVLVAAGYPGKVESGKQIFGLEEAKRVEPRSERDRPRSHAGRGFGPGLQRGADDRIRRQRLSERYRTERAL